MKVIRKRLYESEGLSPWVRWDETCECVQTLFGDTWVDTPLADPRFNPGNVAPANTESDPRCAAAAGMRQKVEDIMDAFFLADALIDAANSVLAVITITLPGVGLIWRVIFAVCEALYAIGTAALVAAFTESAYDELQCIFYDNIGTDGLMSESQLSDINTQICEEMDITICAAMGLILNMLGWVGMSNAGSMFADSAADCSDCCDNTPFTVYTTFDLGGYPYTIIEGSLNGGGQAGSCAANETPTPRISPAVGQDVFCYVDVLFPAGMTLTAITYYIKGQRSDAGSAGVGTGYIVYDADDNVLVEKTYAEDANLGWRLVNFGTISALNARRVRFRVGMGTSDTGSWTVFAGLDTITINGTEC